MHATRNTNTGGREEATGADYAAPDATGRPPARSAFAARRLPGTPSPVITRQERGSKGRKGRGAQAFEKTTTCAQMSSPVMVGEAGVEPAWADGPGDFKSPRPDSQAFAGALVTNSDSRRAAHLQRAEQNAAPNTDLPTDLTQVTTAWPALPKHIKAAILALIQTAAGTVGVLVFVCLECEHKGNRPSEAVRGDLGDEWANPTPEGAQTRYGPTVTAWGDPGGRNGGDDEG